MDDPVVGGYTPDKVALRRAVTMGYNIPEEIRVIQQGQATPANQIVPPTVSGHDDTLPPRAIYDPAGARALLDRFGHKDRDNDGNRELPDGRPLTLRLSSSPLPVDRQIDELWLRSMNAIGVLDGSNAVVALDTSESRVDYILLGPSTRRSISTGALTLTPQPPAVVIAQVDEFHHAGLRHYYMTADDAEKQALDTGVHPGWQRTGQSFKAYAAGSRAGGAINPVCRFYSPPLIEVEELEEVGADSHFFSADAGACMTVFRKSWWFWGYPQDNVFQVDLPDRKTGACPGGTIPVYRLWNQRVDSNHRYTTSTAVKSQMVAAGYRAEGYGPDHVVMCAVR